MEIGNENVMLERQKRCGGGANYIVAWEAMYAFRSSCWLLSFHDSRHSLHPEKGRSNRGRSIFFGEELTFERRDERLNQENGNP